MEIGNRFRCLICDSEALVIRTGTGVARPVCCNQPMQLQKRRAQMYRCPVCGSEAAVIRSKSDGLRLVCCNVPMRALVRRAA